MALLTFPWLDRAVSQHIDKARDTWSSDVISTRRLLFRPSAMSLEGTTQVDILMTKVRYLGEN